jgi:hypothetical protein
MPTDSPELIDSQSEKKKKPDPEVPGLKKRKPIDPVEEGAAQSDKNPLAELMNTLQLRVENINKAVNQASGLNTASNFVQGLVDKAFSSDNSDDIKESAEQTKSKPAPFNLSPMSDAVSSDTLLDTLDFNQVSKTGKEKESESPSLESETHLTYS